jgi:predicted transcriptional regulator
MTSASDRLAAALAVWPLDHEQMSFVQQATAGIGDNQAKALVALLLEAESAVISCANVLRGDTQSAQRASNRQQPIREEGRLVARPSREIAGGGGLGVANEGLLQVTADVVAAYVSNNPLPTAQLAQLINAVYNSMRALEEEKTPEPPKPAVPIRKSVTPDYLVCLEDGKKLKMLKRHLRSTYNMTPDEYRAKWGLQSDYPMVAPNYAEQRSAAAKRIGLGRGTKHRAAYRSRRGEVA